MVRKVAFKIAEHAADKFGEVDAVVGLVCACLMNFTLRPPGHDDSM